MGKEINSESQHNISFDSRRNFDWGPPIGLVSDRMKEAALYVFVFLILAGCGWFLFDSTREIKTTPDVVDTKAEQMETKHLQEPIPPKPIEQKKPAPQPEPTPSVPAKATFMVQLGAFADEESTKETLDRLKKSGFTASTSAPDEQYEMYRLFMGPFADEAEAESLSRKLNELDFPCFVIESP